MQTVSETYAALWRSGRHRKEHKAVIAGVEYGEDEIVGTPVVTRSLFAQNGPGVGACVAGQLELSVLPQGEIPRMAEIKLETRLASDTYSASAMSFMKPIAQELSFRTVTPDGQVWYFELPYREDQVNGSMMHAVGLEWSVSAGITGSVSGGYKDNTTGESVVWGEDLVFSKTAPNHSTADFSTVKPWSVSGTEYSEWIPKGTFYIDTRKLDTESGVLTLHGYDAMLKSEVQFLTEGDVGAWPRSCVMLVRQICLLIGVSLDNRTELEPGIEVSYPNDWTCREILSYIAIAHCGNWTITDEGKLRLVPLWSIPEATHYLVDQYGDPITLGGVKILVD